MINDSKTNDLAEYVKRTAQIMDLAIAPEYLPRVIDNMTRMAQIAVLVTEFELKDKNIQFIRRASLQCLKNGKTRRHSSRRSRS